MADKITELLKNIPAGENSGTTDERWYWAAPILLDLQAHPESTRNWFAQRLLSDLWKGEHAQLEPAAISEEEESETDGNEAWRDHVAEAQKLVRGPVLLGPRPTDLANVLAQLSIGGPATVALRALSRVCGGSKVLDKDRLRNDAAAIGWAFRSLFNLPEVTALIRSRNDQEPYWLRVVEYCVDGCLQSVLDEFAHVLLELEGVAHRPAAEAADVIAARMRDALQLRAASPKIDVFDIDGPAQTITQADGRMRSRFAARYGAKKTDEGPSAFRQDDVCAAFNSPFWPFVLCSTSVGQEGLDFHPYCHAVVHWNLPSNPVDLEQREGRVHRYKGHAVRKNVAALYGFSARDGGCNDPWAAMFREAVAKSDGESDLMPFWVLPIENGATIERHVPTLPLSRDATRYVLLRRALAVYRLAFGQVRQEDLVEYLQQRLPLDAIDRIASELRIDLAPPKTNWAVTSNDVERIVVESIEVADEDAWVVGTGGAGDIVLTTDRLVELLDQYAEIASVTNDGSEDVIRYRELLDSFNQRCSAV